MSDTILSLARGLVRPVLSFAFGFAVVVRFLQGEIPVETFLPIAATIITFWFTTRKPSS